MSDLRITYGRTIRWRKGWLSECAITVYAKDMEAADYATEKMARDMGWTPRRWWQFWRWGE